MNRQKTIRKLWFSKCGFSMWFPCGSVSFSDGILLLSPTCGSHENLIIMFSVSDLYRNVGAYIKAMNAQHEFIRFKTLF